ncbi:hypothetical protein N7490_008307 [Penicillium lividum]|nr:hypothetical protein N7490_008307 [Penicillium lividum]
MKHDIMVLVLHIVAAAAVFLIYHLLAATLVTRRPPKGLRGLRDVPDAGDASQLGVHPQWQLQKWAVEHGELFKVRLGRKQWIYVNSPAAVKEIFDKQSQHSSSRAPSPVVSNFLSGGMGFLLMSHSPHWRKLRAIVHKVLTPKSSNTCMPFQEFEAKQLLWDILNDNKDQEVSTSIFADIPHLDCEDIREIYGLMEEFSKAATPGKYMAETLPVLAKLPAWMQWWMKEALKRRLICLDRLKSARKGSLLLIIEEESRAVT